MTRRELRGFCAPGMVRFERMFPEIPCNKKTDILLIHLWKMELYIKMYEADEWIGKRISGTERNAPYCL